MAAHILVASLFIWNNCSQVQQLACVEWRQTSWQPDTLSEMESQFALNWCFLPSDSCVHKEFLNYSRVQLSTSLYCIVLKWTVLYFFTLLYYLVSKIIFQGRPLTCISVCLRLCLSHACLKLHVHFFCPCFLLLPSLEMTCRNNPSHRSQVRKYYTGSKDNAKSGKGVGMWMLQILQRYNQVQKKKKYVNTGKTSKIQQSTAKI